MYTKTLTLTSTDKNYLYELLKKKYHASEVVRDQIAEIKEGGIFVSKKGEVLIAQTKEEFSEAAITAKIKAKYARSPKVTALHINVTTVKDQVILAGTVHCKEEIVEAINLALGVEGVENVTSLLEIRK